MRTLSRIHVQSRYIPVVTITMISLLILSFFLEMKVGAPYSPVTLASLFSVSRDAVRSGNFSRLITASFFHVNQGHLLSNIMGLLFFLSMLEILVGKARVIIVVLLSALGGTIGSLVFHIVDWMVGSSTILFGVFGGLGVLMLKHRSALQWHFIPILISWCVSLILLATLGYVSLEHVDQGAHVGGIITGILSTWILVDPGSMADAGKPLGTRARIVLIALIAVFGMSIIKEFILLLPMLV